MHISDPNPNVDAVIIEGVKNELSSLFESWEYPEDTAEALSQDIADSVISLSHHLSSTNINSYQEQLLKLDLNQREIVSTTLKKVFDGDEYKALRETIDFSLLIENKEMGTTSEDTSTHEHNIESVSSNLIGNIE